MSNVTKGKRVLADLSTKFAAQIEAAKAPATKAAPKTFDGSPYKAPAIGSYVATKGKAIGQRKFNLQFEHKANPAWSRRFDVTDLELILDNIEDCKAALKALKSLTVRG